MKYQFIQAQRAQHRLGGSVRLGRQPERILRLAPSSSRVYARRPTRAWWRE